MSDQSIAIAEFVDFCKKKNPGRSATFDQCLDVVRSDHKDHRSGKFRFEVFCRPFEQADVGTIAKEFLFDLSLHRGADARSHDRRPGKYNGFIACRVRAIQGHSGEGSSAKDLGREPLDPAQADFPKVIAHGTNQDATRGILAEGLVPGGHRKSRADNHFVPASRVVQNGKWQPPAQSLAGFRSQSDVVMLFDTMKILEAGITLYWSPSGCILTD
jgi:hypothetical protein